MDSGTRSEAAARLLAAYETKAAIPPLTATYDGMTLEDAYAVQLLQVQQLLSRGRTVRGHKVGLTSAAMQQLLGVDEPDYGHLFDDFFHREEVPISTEAFLQARIEPEVAFVLKEPLKGPGVSVDEAVRAVEFVVPALEIVDSRIENWKIGLFDTIADNASSGAVVLGSTPTAPDAIDLRMANCTFHRNGAVVGTGKGSAVMGNPLNVLVWLANTLGARGIALEPGHVVLPGAVCAMVEIAPGDTFRATFAGLGSVTARFADSAPTPIPSAESRETS